MRRMGLLASLLIASGVVTAANDWPNWRGPDRTGVADGQPLPHTWSETDNIAWKAPITGLGVSSPIVSGDHVIVTSMVGPGLRREGNHPTLIEGGEARTEGERPLGGDRREQLRKGDTAFIVEAFSRTNGRRLWSYRLGAAGSLPPVHDKHNLASPSPVTDGERVYAWFGTGQLVVLDMDGRLIWERNLGADSPFVLNWGHGSSPTLYGDSLILLCDHEPASYLLALDKRTGRQLWKVDRGQGRRSWSTPVPIETPSGPELIVNSNERVDAYDPRDGTFLWHIGDTNRFPIPVASYVDGVIYMSRGYRSGPYLAMQPGGRGDATPQVLWQVETGAPYISSLVKYRDHLYMANDNGIATVVDAATGRKVWQHRFGGPFASSPVAGNGKVYFTNETGKTFVVKAGAPPEIIATNDVGERVVASPAIAGGQIFLRTDDHVIAVGKR